MQKTSKFPENIISCNVCNLFYRLRIKVQVKTKKNFIGRKQWSPNFFLKGQITVRIDISGPDTNEVLYEIL